MVILKFNQENDIPKVLELLKDDEAIKHRFQNTLSRENDYIYVAELNGLTVGILIINIQSKRSVAITIYVNKSYRNLGIGSKLCLHADQLLQETPYIYAECEMEANDVVAKFLEKRGYIRSYTVLRMERDNILISPIELSDSSLAKRGIIIRSYRDSDYLAYHNIVNVGFYIMRKKVCAIQWYNPPSEQERVTLANSSCRYVLIDQDEIVAICKIIGNDVALLGVRPDKQLQGYGTLMLSYAINKIANEQSTDKITIGVLTGNPAEKLYRKMGFMEVCRNYNYVKFYKPDNRPNHPMGYENDEAILEAFRCYGMLQEDMIP